MQKKNHFSSACFFKPLENLVVDENLSNAWAYIKRNILSGYITGLLPASLFVSGWQEQATYVLRRKRLQIFAVIAYLLTCDSFRFHNCILLVLLNNIFLTSSSQAEAEEILGALCGLPGGCIMWQTEPKNGPLEMTSTQTGIYICVG